VALTLVVRSSNYFLSHCLPLSAVYLRSLRLLVLFLRLRTKVRAECNLDSGHR
jgi:hypothetical protein